MFEIYDWLCFLSEIKVNGVFHIVSTKLAIKSDTSKWEGRRQKQEVRNQKGGGST